MFKKIFLILLYCCWISTNIFCQPQAFNQTDTFQIDFIDVGQGDSELIKTASGNYFLIDANGDATQQYLAVKKIKNLTAIFLTHPHFDHYSGLASVINHEKIAHFYETGYPSSNKTFLQLLSQISQKNIPKTELKQGDRLTLDNLTLKILNPPLGFLKTHSPINDNSMVIKVSNRAGFSVLLLGDAETTALDQNPFTSYLDSDILKASHHGSRTGINAHLLQIISPKAVIISVGQPNSYGHPHPQALAIYQMAPVYRTDQNGTIHLAVTGNVYEIKNRNPK